jgi:hypothetical protein
MRKFALPFVSLGIALVPTLNAAPASAQLDHTYVSRTGGGSTCSFASPCNSINAAIAATNSGGDVSILNGDYTENVVIDRALGISGESTDNVIIRATTTNNTSTTVTVNAPNNANVSLSHLNIYADMNGVTFNSGRRLNINAGTGITGAGNIGLNFIPGVPAAGGVPTQLAIDDASIGGSGSQGNILIKPFAGVAVTGFMNHARLSRGTFGLRADDTGGSGAITVVFQNGWSNLHTKSGFVALGTSGGSVSVVVNHSTAQSNTYGAVAAGSQASMIVSDSTITFNSVGLDQELGALLADYANNAINFNSVADTSGTITTLSKK